VTTPNIMDIRTQLLGAAITTTMTLFFMVFRIYFHVGKQSQINWYFGNYLNSPKNQGNHLTYSRVRPFPPSRLPSRIVWRPLYTCMY
jgi:hypothetical protein